MGMSVSTMYFLLSRTDDGPVVEGEEVPGVDLCWSPGVVAVRGGLAQRFRRDHDVGEPAS